MKIFFNSILLLSIMIFSACKKGKEDPFISFKSREKRIVGEWTSSQQLIQYTVTSQSSKPYTVTYDNLTLKGAGEDLTLSGEMNSAKLNIKEDGTFTESIKTNWAKVYFMGFTSSSGPSESITEGTWKLLGRNSDYKNKEVIELTYLNSYSPSNLNFKTTIVNGSLKCRIIKLSEDEIKLESIEKVEMVRKTSNNGTVYQDVIYTYEPGSYYSVFNK